MSELADAAFAAVKPHVYSMDEGHVQSALAIALAPFELKLTLLQAAVDWVMPPFVDGNTPEDELRKRIKFLVQDAERANG